MHDSALGKGEVEGSIPSGSTSLSLYEQATIGRT
jgi:hypothetical protein